MKKIAVYDPYLTGHHVEYIYHLIKYWHTQKPKFEMYLFVSQGFLENLRELFDTDLLHSSPEIHIKYIQDLVDRENFSIEQSLSNYKIQLSYLNKFIEQHDIDHCVFMYLDNAMQIALSMRVGRSLKCGISGIVFNPFGGFGAGLMKYYYSTRRVLQNYIMMSNPIIKGVYIIIDQKTADRLNLMHFTRRFIFVSDPILKIDQIPIQTDGEVNSHDRITFLLFGSLNKRKGIFKTLQAVNLLSEEELSKIKIVFAGKLAPVDKVAFLSEYKNLKKRDKGVLELYDEFISYNDVPRLFDSADYILLPYDATQASSGILGHAAFYRKPILGQGGGIFEEHVAKFKLGKTVAEMDETKLCDLIRNIISNHIQIPFDVEGSAKYLDFRSSEVFAAKILGKALS